MAKKSKKSKIPKDGTFKRIEWELEQQGALSRDIEDGTAFFVHGRFSSASIGAFTDRYRFHAEPISTLVVFKENRRIKEELRFGDSDIDGWFTLEKDGSKFNFHRSRSYGYRDSSRYIAITNYHGSSKNYFYMDRVI